MDEARIFLTVEQAEALLRDSAEYIHNYSNPRGGMFIGIDYSREDAISAFKRAHQIEIGGDACKRLSHPLIVWDSPSHWTMFEADMDKVRAFEDLRTESANASE